MRDIGQVNSIGRIVRHLLVMNPRTGFLQTKTTIGFLHVKLQLFAIQNSQQSSGGQLLSKNGTNTNVLHNVDVKK